MKKERIHVLLVEDEEAHAELIKRSFESQEDVIQLTVAKSLHEAQESLAEEIPDLAIVDLFLPDGRGLELLDEEKENDYPVVIMTSHGDEEVAVEAMKAGALQYVVKSEIALTELPHKVETALRQWGHIVERKQAEEAMKASEEHFRSLIENALDIILVVNEAGIIQYASPSFERILGYAGDERVGRSFFDLVHEDDLEALGAVVEKAFSEPPTGHRVYRHRHRDGSWRFLEAVGSSYVDSNGDRRGVINSRDVTDRQKAQDAQHELEKRLRRSQKWETVANLSRDIARELHQILNPILDYATMALTETEPESKSRAGLERVLGAASRARELVERIFIFSRRVPPKAQTVRLDEIVAREIETRRAELPDDVTLETRIADDVAPVLADPEQIVEVLGNLWSNSLHALRDGGELEIEVGMIDTDIDGGTEEGTDTGDDTASPSRCARLTVRDSGHGMDPSTVERALEPFFTTKATREGAGLGLSVVNAIIASHGGELTVQSKPEEGTMIHVDLPIA